MAPSGKRGQSVRSGHAAGFSFQSSKNLASGEGGALTTNDEQVFERAYSMHNAGRSRIESGRWEHVTLGWNCRMTEYQAGLLIHRFKVFDRMQAVRRKNFQYLRDLMGEVACLEPLALCSGVRSSRYVYVRDALSAGTLREAFYRKFLGVSSS